MNTNVNTIWKFTYWLASAFLLWTIAGIIQVGIELWVNNSGDALARGERWGDFAILIIQLLLTFWLLVFARNRAHPKNSKLDGKITPS